jgi:hypothetical protein
MLAAAQRLTRRPLLQRVQRPGVDRAVEVGNAAAGSAVSLPARMVVVSVGTIARICRNREQPDRAAGDHLTGRSETMSPSRRVLYIPIAWCIGAAEQGFLLS